MAYERDPRVDAYIERLPEWQQATCERVRDVVHVAMLRRTIANNRAGGWRKLKGAGS